MKTTILLLLFTVLILSSGCNQSIDYVHLADQVTNRTAKQLKDEKELKAYGTGGGMMGDIYLMRMYFQYCHLVNLEEARKLSVYATQTYLNNINADKAVRPYLHVYPFTVKNVEIIICFTQPDGNFPPIGDIAGASLRSGVIEYDLMSGEKLGPAPILHEETYEEALEILRQTPETDKRMHSKE